MSEATVAAYLKQRLEELGLERLFVVAGNYTAFVGRMSMVCMNSAWYGREQMTRTLIRYFRSQPATRRNSKSGRRY